MEDIGSLLLVQKLDDDFDGDINDTMWAVSSVALFKVDRSQIFAVWVQTPLSNDEKNIPNSQEINRQKHTLGLLSSSRPVLTAHGCMSNTYRSALTIQKSWIISVLLHVVRGKYQTVRYWDWEWVEMVKWNGPFRSDRSNRENWYTSKSKPIFSKLFRLDRTYPFNFRSKFPEILFQWIAP